MISVLRRPDLKLVEKQAKLTLAEAEHHQRNTHFKSTTSLFGILPASISGSFCFGEEETATDISAHHKNLQKD